MIPAQELRIGNWVYESPKTKFPMYVTAIGEDWVQLNFPENEGDIWESEEVEPIPLTAAIDKIGAVNYHLFWEHPGFTIQQNQDVFYYQSKKDPFRHTVVTIQYLHELQNLYYITNKEELKVRL